MTIILLFLLVILSGLENPSYSSDFMPIDNIKAGMQGFGLTVFQGTKIDTFKVEIIEVMHNYRPKGDVILARLSGGPIETAGVISGMSGSPVYINNKLIGAVALGGGAFSKEPICGITPINEILNPPAVKGLKQGLLTPIKIPISFSNIDERTLNIIKDDFKNCNFIGTGTQGGTPFKTQNSKLKTQSVSPGASLGIVLVEGDANIAAIGTCTYKKGNKIWAFGHPAFSLGETSLPMTTGYVYSVIPSMYHSYKIATSSEIIGTVKNDGSRGIYGTIGTIPQMTTLELSINKERFSYRIIKEKHLLPTLIDAMVLNSIFTCSGIGEELMVKTETEIAIKDYEPIKYTRCLAGSPDAIIKYINQPIHILKTNPFKKVDIQKITMELSIYKELNIAQIIDVVTERKKVQPGDSITVYMVLQPYQKELIKKRVKIKIPEWAEKEKIELTVGRDIQKQGENLKNVINMDGLVKYLEDFPKENELTITLSQKGRTTYISGDEFSSIPPSLSVPTSREEELKQETVIFKKKIETEYIISGQKKISLEVE